MPTLMDGDERRVMSGFWVTLTLLVLILIGAWTVLTWAIGWIW